MNTEQLITLLKEEQETQAALKALKEREAELRKIICFELLENKPAGLHRFTFQNMKVTAKRVINHVLDQKQVSRLIADMEFSQEELDAIRVKYELKLTEYKKLESCPLLEDCITVTDGMPTLEIEYV